MKFPKFIKSIVLLLVVGTMTASCSNDSQPTSSASSSIISSLTSGDSWSSDTGFSSSSSEETPKNVTISFATGEGSHVASITVQAGYSFSEGAFERPTRAHYQFAGWYMDGNYNLAVSYPFVAISDTTLYAKWVPIRHLVCFVTGTAETMNPIYVNDGDYVQEPVPPANGNSKFAGWYLDEELTQKAYFPFIVTQPITFYAKYEIVLRTITFHVNGGSPIRPLLVEDGEVITDPFESPTHQYFAFAGWYYDDQFEEPVQYPLIVSENLNLFAKWAQTETKISFVTNGGSEINDVVVEKGSIVRSLPTPILENAVFLGWFLDQELSNPVTLPFTATTDIILYASWLIGRSRLSFETNGGSVVPPIDVVTGETIEESQISTPTKAHYKFLGWFTDPNCTTSASFPMVINSSIVLYAKWEAVSYTITFHSNGGSPVEAKTIAYGSTIASSPETKRAGYEFLGWFLDSELTELAQFPYSVSGNAVLYAKWKEITYSVSFNTNGAEDYPAIEKKYGEILEEKELPTPTKTRNSFLGWYRDFGLTEKAVFPIEITGNITLHAKWEFVSTFSVRFDANGGSGGAYYVVENGNSIESAPEPSRAGYSFAGWYLDKDCTELAKFPYVVNQSVTFFAKWEALSCRITYNTNGGDAIDATTMAYGDELSTPPTPTKEGSVFLGWYLDPQFNTLAAFPMIVNEDLTFYAKWREITYCTVSFSNDGEVTSIKVEKGKAVEEPSEPKKDGYSFLGWYLDPNFSAPANFPYLATESMTFYAKWQKNEGTATVMFETNGGTSVTPSVLQIGSTLEEPASPVSARGEFLGWYLDEALTNKASFPLEVFADMTLYAKYASYEQTYTVSFDTNGGSSVPSQIVYATGSLIAAPATPTNPGLVFAGWYLDQEFSTPATFPMGISKDTILYAKWDDDPGIYRVTFHDGVNNDTVYLLNPGDSLPRPTDPTRAGYVFGGWYSNEACTGVAVSFPYTPRNDMTLYAKWTLEIVEYTVTWIFNDGSANQTQTVDNDTAISARNPSRDGYDFVGWYSDPELTQKVSFPYRVNGDVSFYAKWEKQAVTYTVSYQTNGGTVLPSTTVGEGGSISAPTAPTRSGYIFKGWYLDEECTQKATFPMTVDKDITIYAGWEVDEYANFTFEYSGSLGGYVLTGYSGADKNVILPETYNDGIHGQASVVAIGKSAFENCSSIVSIAIPDTVVSIGDSAFFGCSSLESIMIPASVTALGTRTFYKCTALSEVNLPDTIESIGAWSFYGCSSLKTIVLPAELTAISDYLFYSSGLERIVIHSNCLSIGNFAFYNCTSLTQADIAEGCTSIGNNAFRACGLLRQITIPITVKTIGSYVFVDDEFIVIYCSHASNPDGFVSVWARMSSDPDDTSTAPIIYNYGGAYTRVGDVVYALLKDGSVSATYVGPRDVTSIVLEEQVVINEKIYDVTVIGTRGFRNLKSLSSVTLPAKLQVIGSYAFQGCSALTSISLPATTISIESYAFYNCASLSSISVPSSVSTIGGYSFRGCSSLREIYLPKSVVSIDYYAFSQCNDIVIMYGGNNINLWDTNAVILRNSAGKYAYHDGVYYSLTAAGTVSVSRGDNNLLSATILAQVELDGVIYDVTSVGASAFSGQTLLETVVLPDTITVIENDAFHGCSNLANVNLGKGISSIMSYAFAYCSQLRVIEINSNLKTIGNDIFYQCPNHVTLLVKGEAFSMDPWYYNQNGQRYWSVAFDYRGKYVIVDYVVYALTKDGVVAAGSNGNLHSLTIRDSVEIDGVAYPVVGISEFAFSGMEELSSLTIGSNVKTIGRFAFYYASLSEVVIPESVLSVGREAFNQNSDKKITIYVSSFSVNASFDYSSVAHVYFGTVGPLFTYDGNDYGVTKRGGAILLSWKGSTSGEIELPGSVVDADGVTRAVQAIGQGVFEGATSLKKIILPSSIIAICNRAFRGCYQLEEVIYVGASLSTIGKEAFRGCDALTTSSFLFSVASIGENAFTDCYRLTSLSFGNNLQSIDAYAFYGCSGLRSIVLPDSVKSIGACAFQSCVNAIISLGTNIESIGMYAFSSCARVNAIVFSSSLRSIGEGAFYSTSVEYVYVPRGVSLGSRIFTDGVICFGDDAIDESSLNTLQNNNASVFFGCAGLLYTDSSLYVLFRNGEATFAKYYGSAESVSVLAQVSYQDVTYSVTSIAFAAFRDNAALKSVVLPDSISVIDSYAFANCRSLVEVTWGKGLTLIGSHAFESCLSLQAIVLPEGIITISDYAFAYVVNATVLVPSTVTSIGRNAFVSSNLFLVNENISGADTMNLVDCVIRGGCEALARIGEFDYILFTDNTALVLRYYGIETTVTMSDAVVYNEKNYQVVSIGSGLFASCSLIERVTLPSGITEISSSAFNNCSSLLAIVLPEGVTSIGDHAFNQCYALSSVTMGNNVAFVGAYAFANCNSLITIDLGSNLKEVGAYAFSRCSTLKTVNLGNKVEIIGDYAFYYCSGLTSIPFGEKLVSIGRFAFQHCSSLTTIAMPDTLTSLGECCFANSGLTSLTIGNGLKSLPISAFSQCQSLKSVVISNAVEEIGECAFANCGSLSSITFGTGLRVIGNSAFYCDWNLHYVILPKGLTTLGHGVFENISLAYVYVPSTVTSIGDGCFSQGTIYFGSSYLSNENAVSSNCTRVFNCAGIISQDGSLYVLNKNGTATLLSYSGSETDIVLSTINYDGKQYEITSIANNAFRYSSITSIILPSTLVSIGEEAFRGCSSLTAIALPESLTSIGNYAFADTQISNVVLPNSLTTINAGTFYNCSQLSSVIFGENLISIGQSAFYSCYRITSITLPESLLSIGASAFRYAGLNSVWIPAKVTSIGENAFNNVSVFTARSSFSGDLKTGFENCTFVYSCHILNADNGLSFLLLETGTAEVMSYNGSDANVVIPESVTYESRQYVVSGIRYKAFMNNQSIVSVTLPGTVTEIGGYAFYSCISLKTIDLSHVKIIREHAFQGTVLTSLFLPEITRIEAEAFYQHEKGITMVYIGTDVEYIGNAAFFGQKNSKTILLSVASKGEEWHENWASTYYNCENRQVWGCTGYVIEESMLYYVTSASSDLHMVLMDQSVTSLTLGGTITINGTDYVIETISASAFAYSPLEEITLTETVRTIENNAFYYCTSLKKVTLTNVETIGASAFYYCSSLEDIHFGSSLEEIKDYAFSFCTSLTSAVLPLGFQTLRYDAFQGCTSLQALYLPQTIATVESQWSFKGIVMTPLPSVNWSIDGVPLVCNATGEFFVDGDFIYAVLKNNSGNNYVTIAKYQGNDKDIVLPSSVAYGGKSYDVTTISSYAFSHSNITSVVLPNGLTTVKRCAFYYCEKLTQIEILSGTNFETHAFYMLTKLKFVLIHDGVKVQSSQVFQFENENSNPIFLIEGNTDGWSGSWAYRWNSGNLYSSFPVVQSSTLATFTVDGVIYAPRTDGTVCVVGAESDVTAIALTATVSYQDVVYSVTRIADAAFLRHFSLESVTLPSSITYVGEGAFANCFSLTTVVWSASCEGIRSYTFYGDVMLQSVTLNGDSMTYIGYSAFYSCSSLESIILPASINRIDSDAFYQCIELAHVYSRMDVGGYISIGGQLPNELSIEYGYQDE